MTADTTQKKSGPDFHAYNVKKTGKKDALWTRIGAAWYHEDRTGLNIDLDCIPLDGRIVLRTPLPKDDHEQPDIA